MKTIEFKIEGMSCSHCVQTAQEALSGLGIQAKPDLETGITKATMYESVSMDEIRRALEREGYRVITGGANEN